VATGSRSSEFFGWLRRVLFFASLAAVLWWQEPVTLEELRPEISPNKAESWSSSLLPASRVAAGSSGSSFFGLPWWKSEEASRSSSFNKRVHRRIDGNRAEISPLTGRGGEGVVGFGMPAFDFGRFSGSCAALVSFSTVVSWRPLIFACRWQLSAPVWRLFNLRVRPFSDGSAAAWFVVSLPSGLFPGDGETTVGVRVHPADLVERCRDPTAFSVLVLRSLVQNLGVSM
jgi:hypothetical protein